MFERFTERARQVVVLAQDESRGLGHDYIGTEHILLGLLRERESLAARALGDLEVTLERATELVVRLVGTGEEPNSGQIPFTPPAKRALERSLREAIDLGYNHIGPEHMLLGLISVNEGVAARVLQDLGVDPDRLRAELIRMLPGPDLGGYKTVSSSGPPSLLLTYGVRVQLLARRIRSELGREMDSGDLLLVHACMGGTVASRALSELGLQPEELSRALARVRSSDGELPPEDLPAAYDEARSEIRRRLGLPD